MSNPPKAIYLPKKGGKIQKKLFQRWVARLPPNDPRLKNIIERIKGDGTKQWISEIIQRQVARHQAALERENLLEEIRNRDVIDPNLFDKPTSKWKLITINFPTKPRPSLDPTPYIRIPTRPMPVSKYIKTKSNLPSQIEKPNPATPISPDIDFNQELEKFLNELKPPPTFEDDFVQINLEEDFSLE